MKRAVTLCTLALALALSALADTAGSSLTKEERSYLAQYLRETREKFLQEIAGLSDAQMKFKPDAKSWSVFDIAEHLAKGEDVIYALVTERIMKSPAQPEWKGEKGPRIKDLAIVMYLTNRAANKLQAPEPVQPSGKFASKAEIIASFEKSRARTINYIETTEDDLRGHFRENGIGVIDGYQWLLVVAAHTDRHLEQMREVKAHAGFPSK